MENEAMNIMETVANTVTEDNTAAAPICAQADVANVGKFPIKPLVVGGIIVGTVLLAKSKKIANWFTVKCIESLEKKGYVVLEPKKDGDTGYDYDDACEADIED